jgi:hypothetical protein
MSRQQRLIYLPLIGMLLLCLLVGVYLIAWKRFSKSPSKVTKHSVETPSEDVLAYWTVDRMRQAKPAPLPKVNEHKRGKRPPHSSRPPQV